MNAPTSPHSPGRAAGRRTTLRTTTLGLATLVLLALSDAPTVAQVQDTYDTRLEKGVELYSQSKYPEAGVFFQNLIKSDPARKEAYLWRGKSFAKQGQWAEAREDLKQYARLAPQDAEGPLEVARAYQAEGNADLARLWYKKVLDVNPNHKGAQDTLAKLDQPATKETRPPAEGAAKQDQTKAEPPTDTPAATKDADDDGRASFWQKGVAGLLGARSAWWARLIAVVIFLTSLGSVPAQAKVMAEKFPDMVPGGVMFSSLLGAVGGYILYWGVPQDTGGWVLIVLYTVVMLLLVRQVIVDGANS